MSSAATLLEITGPIAKITLNAEQKRNAIDLAMVESLNAHLDELSSDRDLAALIITGAGDRAFSAGADIAQMRDRGADDAMAAINSGLFKRIEDFAVPVIAAIKGYALGGGCELAIACDLRVAGRSVKMGQPEVKLGIIPAAGGTYRLPRLIGLGRARELIYTGRIIDAEECLRIGLIDRLVADDRVQAEAWALAEEIAANGRSAVRMAKAAINALSRPGEGMASSLESMAQAMLFESDEKRERMTAFLERKKQ